MRRDDDDMDGEEQEERVLTFEEKMKLREQDEGYADRKITLTKQGGKYEKSSQMSREQYSKLSGANRFTNIKN